MSDIHGTVKRNKKRPLALCRSSKVIIIIFLEIQEIGKI